MNVKVQYTEDKSKITDVQILRPEMDLKVINSLLQ